MTGIPHTARQLAALVTLAWACWSPCAIGMAHAPAAPSGDAEPGMRDGQRDFDFSVGTWRTRIRRLAHPLTASREWVDLAGTVTVSKVWNGRATLEELRADGGATHVEGLTLRLYDPQARQWSLYWANSASGTLRAPSVGAFRHGNGAFYSRDEVDGRTVLVRQIYAQIAADSYRFEQAFSTDVGATWETNWVATLTRVAPDGAPAAQARRELDRLEASGQRDFAFTLGPWRMRVLRLGDAVDQWMRRDDHEARGLPRPTWLVDARG
jgi:hypothetical protein